MSDEYDLSKLVTKKKPKRKNSRAKGNRFQNKICKILNERFKTDEFCSTPGSGAFATTHTLPDHLAVHGDIITPKWFKYVLECKKGYNNVKLTDWFNPKSDIWKFIEQSKRDAKAAKNKDWMVIYQQDRSEIICVLNAGSFTVDCFEEILLVNDQYAVVLLEELLELGEHFFGTCERWP